MITLDVRLPKWVQLLVLAALISIPTLVVARYFEPHYGFLNLISFGKDFVPRALPQVQVLAPHTRSRFGSDDQFYAQIAIDPSMRDRAIASACDDPEYRGRRILLPFLAWCVGLGRPLLVLNVYAVSNLAFWYLLLGLLVHFFKPSTLRDWFCIIAIVWTSGVLTSVMYAFVDLPAATLLTAGALASSRFSSVFIALSVLTKETYLLGSWPFIDDAVRAKWCWWKILAHVVIILGPIMIWVIYLHLHFHSTPWQSQDYSWPMAAWVGAIFDFSRRHYIRDAFAALSLLVQFAYFATHWRVDSIWWRFGITFAITAAFLSNEPFIEQKSFTRDLVLLPIAFNLLLMKQRRLFLPWFIGGNVGLVAGLIRAISKIASPYDNLIP